jgi:hypothetical protein
MCAGWRGCSLKLPFPFSGEGPPGVRSSAPPKLIRQLFCWGITRHGHQGVTKRESTGSNRDSKRPRASEPTRPSTRCKYTDLDDRIKRGHDLCRGFPDVVIEVAVIPQAFIDALRIVGAGGQVIEIGNVSPPRRSAWQRRRVDIRDEIGGFDRSLAARPITRVEPSVSRVARGRGTEPWRCAAPPLADDRA